MGLTAEEKEEAALKSARKARVDQIVELCAERAHESWMQSKLDAGITSRPAEDGTEQMVPYDELPENLKDLDRATVRGTIEVLVAENLLNLD